MSTATVSIGPGKAVHVDPLGERGAVLLSLSGDVFGKVHNVALIPLGRIDQLIDALKVAKLVAQTPC
ncbi:hypothetical protein HUU62_04310 [Rhodoferax sp. 4810]|nr:hypothetical protein [Rhodoferax jenense]